MTDTAKSRPARRFVRTPDSKPISDTGAHPQNEAAVATDKPMSKAASIVALMRREEGATLAEMVEATNWLPHTTRAALTGLRKKNQRITKRTRGTTACYHITAEV
jgi:hypothetical protein